MHQLTELSRLQSCIKKENKRSAAAHVSVGLMLLQLLQLTWGLRLASLSGVRHLPVDNKALTQCLCCRAGPRASTQPGMA